MPSICYYVSGHGFGHATRASQIINALLDLQVGGENATTTITVCTLAPKHLFPSSPNLVYRSVEVDSSVIQPLPYEIDIPSTFQALESFIQKVETKDEGVPNSKTWIEQETEFLDENGFDVIIADAPWSVGLLNPTKKAGKEKPIKILITNFTFDLIFHSLATTYLPPSTPPEIAARYLEYYEQVKKGYTSFDHLIRLPAAIDFPFLKEEACKTKVVDAPLVYRVPSIEKEGKNEILQSLNIPEKFWTHKILLVQFGGHAMSASSSPPKIPDGWICLSPRPSGEDEETNGEYNTKFFTFPPQTYLPNLITLSTAVLGKIGYGTVSECIGMGIPLLYVRREMFAEEPYLLKYLSEQGTGLEISKADFEAGEWAESIEQVVANGAGIMGCGDGSMEVAKMVCVLEVRNRLFSQAMIDGAMQRGHSCNMIETSEMDGDGRLEAASRAFREQILGRNRSWWDWGWWN